jgi:hypothetical protein
MSLVIGSASLLSCCTKRRASPSWLRQHLELPALLLKVIHAVAGHSLVNALIHAPFDVEGAGLFKGEDAPVYRLGTIPGGDPPQLS